MRKLLLCALLVASAVPIASADSIMIQSAGATTVTVSGGGPYSNSNFNGWIIFLIAGASSSPGVGSFGLDLAVLAACSSGNCLTNPLNVFYSDTGFSTPVSTGGFQTTYSATMTGGGTTNEIAWANSGNTLFGLGAANKIGSGVGLFSASGGFGTSSGGPAEVAPYSLTIEEILNANNSTSSFGTDADVTATPEPAISLLLGTGLLGLCVLVRCKVFKAA